jgi:outer membrane protein assembly factor BamB
MVSDEKDLPETFDPATGRNLKWSVRLGTQAYATPVIAGGKVLVGTNNARPRDPRHKGDRGVLMCFAEADGRFLWQLVVPKLSHVPLADCAGVGIVSPPTVEGDRAYVVSNRNEVLCLDLNGQANGNDGPFRDEGRLMAPRGAEPMEVGPADADIIWRLDLAAEAGVRQHDAAHCSILLHGRHLYVSTSNGVDGTHRHFPAPDAPSLVVLDKATGRLLAADDARIGRRTIHCMWSSPSLGAVGGRTRVFLGGGDGTCYAFEALADSPPAAQPARLKTIWRFDCDPNAPKQDILRYQDNRREGPSNITGMAVFHEGRIYVAAGGDYWHGKRDTWLKCIDAAGSGDITQTGLVWSCPLESHCLSTPAVRDGLVYIADAGRRVYCLDARTGRPCWTHEMSGGTWGSTLVADGKVYVGTRRGNLWVLAAGRQKRLLATVKLGSAIHATPAAANGVLYVATMTHLYAARKGAR